MGKVIRLSESQIKKIIRDSVREIVNDLVNDEDLEDEDRLQPYAPEMQE